MDEAIVSAWLRRFAPHPEPACKGPLFVKPETALSPVIDRIAVLSEPLRLRALCVLDQAELSVGELARVLASPQSTVSRHLKVLASAGWIVSRSERTATFYRYRAEELDEPDRELWSLLRARIDADGSIASDRRRLQEVLSERPTDSLSFFGRVVGSWDDMRTRLFGDRFTAPALLGLVDPRWTVADIGCGTGNVADLVSPVCARVIAVDQSGPMLDAARQRLAGRDNITFACGPIEALPLESGSLDAAVCALVLHHVQAVEDAIGELARVVRPGGVVLVIDMYTHRRRAFAEQMGHRHPGFDPGKLADRFLTRGFASTLIRPLACGADATGPGLFALSAWKPAPDRIDMPNHNANTKPS